MARRRRKKAGRTIDGLTLLNGDQLEEILRAMPKRIGTKVRKEGLRKSALLLRRELKKAAPAGESGNLKKSIGLKRGRRKYWVGLMKPVPPRKMRRGATRTQVRYYYKALDLTSKRGSPVRPWYENVMEANRLELRRELLESTRSAIRREAGRAHALSRMSAKGGVSRGGRF